MRVQSYLGDPALKAALLGEIKKHEAADQIVKGTYGTMKGSWRGCAIGCSLRSLNLLQGKARPNAGTNQHNRFPKELGIPEVLAYIEDHIFENLPDDLSKTWPYRFAEAVPVGADLSLVFSHLMLWLLDDTRWGVWHATDDLKVQQTVRDMAALFRHECQGEIVPRHDWAAWAAGATGAAWAARTATAAWAAWAAEAAWTAGTAETAEAAEAVRAAEAAWTAGTAEAAEAAEYYVALSERLLGLLREVPL